MRSSTRVVPSLGTWAVFKFKYMLILHTVPVPFSADSELVKNLVLSLPVQLRL